MVTWTFDRFNDALRQRLEEGFPADVNLERYARDDMHIGGSCPEDARDAAILVLVYPWKGELYFTITQRAQNLDFGGAFVFPGGKPEEQDRGDPKRTARREAAEEVAEAAWDAEILGEFPSVYLRQPNFYIRGFLGCLPARPRFHKVGADHTEVAAIVEVPLRALLGRNVTASVYRPQSSMPEPGLKLRPAKVHPESAVVPWCPLVSSSAIFGGAFRESLLSNERVV